MSIATEIAPIVKVAINGKAVSVAKLAEIVLKKKPTWRDDVTDAEARAARVQRDVRLAIDALRRGSSRVDAEGKPLNPGLNIKRLSPGVFGLNVKA